MEWQFLKDRPIYTQIIDQMEKAVVSGQYPPSSKIPSIRDLSVEAGVNPNTMQRALAELERNGLIVTERTNGKFVTDDMELIQSIKEKFACQAVNDFIASMNAIGIQDKNEMLNFIKEMKENENNS